MKLLFKQRIFAWTSSYNIYDEFGNVVFMAKAEFPLGITVTVSDAQGNEIGYVNREFAFMPTFELYQGDECVGTLRRKAFWNQNYAVDHKNWHVEGDFFGFNYQILDMAGQCVAEMSKEIINLQDTYSIDVRNPEDALMVLMVVLAIDMEKDARN